MPEVYNLSVEEALKLHGHSDDEAGLSDAQVGELQAKYGKNELECVRHSLTLLLSRCPHVAAPK